jgi:hypothetical protein
MAERELVVPSGQFAVVYVSFDCHYHNRVRILNDQREVDQEYMSALVPGGRRQKWESGPNTTDADKVYYIHVEHKNSADFDDNDWYENDEREGRKQGSPPEPRSYITYGYEDGEDGDFNDVIVTIHWGLNEEFQDFVASEEKTALSYE